MSTNNTLASGLDNLKGKSHGLLFSKQGLDIFPFHGEHCTDKGQGSVKELLQMVQSGVIRRGQAWVFYCSILAIVHVLKLGLLATDRTCRSAVFWLSAGRSRSVFGMSWDQPAGQLLLVPVNSIPLFDCSWGHFFFKQRVEGFKETPTFLPTFREAKLHGLREQPHEGAPFSDTRKSCCPATVG